MVALISRGAGYSILSSLSFLSLQAIIKSYEDVDILEFIFFRGLFGWFFCLFYLLRNKVSLVPNCTFLIILRSVFGLLAMIFFMESLRHIPFGVAVTISQMYPILIAILAIFFLGEKIRFSHWIFLLLSFLGVLLIKNFNAQTNLYYFILCLIATVFVAGVFIAIRKIGDRDHPMIIVHYFMFFTALFTGIVVLPSWSPPTLEHWGALFLVSCLGCLGQFFMTRSIQLEQVHKVAKWGYLKNVFAFIIGYVVFSESYTFTALLGVLLIVVSAFSDLSFRKIRRMPGIRL